MRPLSTAERAIGSERKRSISPLLRSSAIPIAVVIEAKPSVWTKIPGIRYSLYEPPPGSGIAPPNT